MSSLNQVNGSAVSLPPTPSPITVEPDPDLCDPKTGRMCEEVLKHTSAKPGAKGIVRINASRGLKRFTYLRLYKSARQGGPIAIDGCPFCRVDISKGYKLGGE